MNTSGEKGSLPEAGSFPWFFAQVIVRVTFDVILLPVAEGDFEHAHRLFTGATESVFFVGGNPDLLTGLVIAGRVTDLHHRIRDVRQGADGLIYVLTDEDNGALLRLEPESAR